ncbi:uncharacterized protein N7506_006102 [Penicillium brevicompactum]|uniref:uncharacterized protein n=1 Tax=Penicillium brevicompactum TaxID=5074 RepID=UPI00254046B0|nr:uncharacterized protein N7506_006102 [Penicillium brevicompactum]KAJ5332319.1 hypothetical protein N7506_006102 [Penicillium brevicompactum]
MEWPCHTANSLEVSDLDWHIDDSGNINEACILQTSLLQTENSFSTSTNDDPSVGGFFEYPDAQIHTDPVELSPWYQLDLQEFGQYRANLPSNQPRAIGTGYIGTENITQTTSPDQNAPIHEACVSTGCTGTHTEWQIGSDNQLKRQKKQANGLRKGTVGVFRCDWKDCAYSGTFACKRSVMRHVETQHITPRSVPCFECGQLFGRRDNMTEHLGRVHGVRG